MLQGLPFPPILFAPFHYLLKFFPVIFQLAFLPFESSTLLLINLNSLSSCLFYIINQHVPYPIITEVCAFKCYLSVKTIFPVSFLSGDWVTDILIVNTTTNDNNNNIRKFYLHNLHKATFKILFTWISSKYLCYNEPKY